MSTMENRAAKKRDGSNQPLNFTDLFTWGVRQRVVLVAYDKVVTRNLVTTLMQDEGYFVLSASDGQEALEISRKYPGTIDMVLTDVKMPRLSCTDLCTCVLDERPGIKVLVMSGADVDETETYVNLPFLPRPFDGELLKRKIRTILAAPVQFSPYVYMVFFGSPPLGHPRERLPIPRYASVS
jgi:CheY-like chemotaxis protein